MIEEYLQEIFKKFKTSDASERTYYPPLSNLLEKIASELGDFSVLVEGRNSSVGIPDFKIKDGKDLLIGYVEAKDLGRDLDRLSDGEDKQIERYIKEYDKLIVTNFIEFRLYQDHKIIDTVLISQPVTLELLHPVLENEAHFKSLLERFFYNPIQQIHSARRLSEILARKTRTLRDLILEEIDLDDDKTTSTEKLLDTFRKTLDKEMKEQEFADMYAQTITFGLFVARINSGDKEFTRFSAFKFIPNTISLLKEIFKLLSWEDLPSHIEWQVDEIVETLAYTNIDRITSEFFSEGKGRDPIIHFYETFLADYDPKEREKRGVYYTPQQVVSYIARSVHKLLQEKFGINDGFADPSITLLDPAGGTLTFPAEAISIAKEEFVSKHGNGNWKSLVKNHLLRDFYAFELLMAPYAIGHLKISLLLKELGYEIEEDDRFKLYLTNTLDFREVETLPLLVLAEEITEESKKAYEVKTKEKILVVMGNPPYSGHSENKDEWIMEQMKEYKQVDGHSLGERNPKWLNDDYVKFMRFAQWKIEQAKTGVMGFITNHAWLDNPTFRGMRASLLKTFDEIYVLNLHGSVLKKEKTPEGGIDENVFDIQPGTAITLCIKASKKTSDAKVNYSDLWGLRDDKYRFLDTHDVNNTQWTELKPSKPSYYFIKRDERGRKAYEQFTPVMDIFIQKSIGLFTARDALTIHFTKEDMWKTIQNFISLDPEFARSAYNLGEDVRDWKVHFAQEDVRSTGPDKKHITEIAYRPFDTRFTYFTGKSRGFHCMPRPQFMPHMLQDNLAICVGRFGAAVGGANVWDIAFVSNAITDLNLFRRGGNQVLPLYLYKNDQGELFNKKDKSENINWKSLPDWIVRFVPFTSRISANHIQTPLAIFCYIYAVLYSDIYREKYREFLKSDFPRIPFTKDYELFKSLVEFGEQLVQSHLLKAKDLDTSFSKFMGDGDGRVGKVVYDEENKRIYVNNSQYFDNVTPEIWKYYIGGYQVLQKWMKDRKGRSLSLEDSMHYSKIISSLARTIDIQKKIDELYPQVEKSLAI